MLKRFYIFVLVTGFFQVVGQESILNERFIRFKAYQIINEYTYKVTLERQRDEAIFLKLFTENAQIVNDILPMNNQDSIWDIRDYTEINAKIIDPEKSVINLHLKSIHLSKNLKSPNTGTIRVEANKYLFLTGVASGRSYSDTLNLVFDMVYSDTTVQISEISLTEQPVKYSFLDFKNQGRGKRLIYDSYEFKSVLINGNSYTLTPFGNVFLKHEANENFFNVRIEGSSEYIGKKRFKIDEFGGEKVSSKSDFTNFKDVPYKRKKIFISGTYSLLSNISDREFGEGYMGVLQKTNNDFVGSLGLILINQKRKPFEVRAELGFLSSSTSYSIMLGDYAEDFDDIDSDLHEYHRNVRLTDFEEIGRIDYQAISGSLKFYIGLSSWFNNLSVFGGLNYRSTLKASSTYTSNASALYSGQYDSEYYNFSIAENGIYDFGEHELSIQASNNLTSLRSFLGYQYGFNYEISPRVEVESYLSISNSISDVGLDHITRTAFSVGSMFRNSTRSPFSSLSLGFCVNYYLK